MNTFQKSYGFLALALRQRLIKRWSLMHCTQSESVLEHAAVVSLLALLIGHTAQRNGKKVNLQAMLTFALLHDTAEVLFSDIALPVKHHPESREVFQRLEQLAEKQLIDTLPETLRDEIAVGFSPGGIEQQLVKACDAYAAWIKCRQEVAAGNTLEFQEALVETGERVEKLKKEHPELAQLDAWFGEGIDKSVDTLLKQYN